MENVILLKIKILVTILNFVETLMSTIENLQVAWNYAVSYDELVENSGIF